jgi:hypothetical protein
MVPNANASIKVIFFILVSSLKDLRGYVANMTNPLNSYVKQKSTDYIKTANNHIS